MSLSSRARPENVGARDRRKVLEDAEYICYYCESPWAGVVDHVRPVTQGGARGIGNLVAACNRCNAEKGGRTPREWRDWRLERGYPWPPPNPINYVHEMLSTCTEGELVKMNGASQAADSRSLAALRDILRGHHQGKPVGYPEAKELLVRAAELFAHERDV